MNIVPEIVDLGTLRRSSAATRAVIRFSPCPSLLGPSDEDGVADDGDVEAAIRNGLVGGHQQTRGQEPVVTVPLLDSPWS